MSLLPVVIPAGHGQADHAPERSMRPMFVLTIVVMLLLLMGKRWRRRVVRVLKPAFLVGAIGFAAGFFGPMIVAPDANQGPLVGIFITGPLSFVLGLVVGVVRVVMSPDDRRPTILPLDKVRRVTRIYYADHELDNWFACAQLTAGGNVDYRLATASRSEAIATARAMAAEVLQATGRIIRVEQR